jgi:hypothetical protein
LLLISVCFEGITGAEVTFAYCAGFNLVLSFTFFNKENSSEASESD